MIFCVCCVILYLWKMTRLLLANSITSNGTKWQCIHTSFIFCLCSSIFRYYAFDDMFVREVLGKKLSKGTKKDLDDISAKTGVTLKSCRRQVNVTSEPLCIHTFSAEVVGAHHFFLKESSADLN